MAAGGAPVVLVPNGAPVTPGPRGTPVTITGGNVAVVPDGSSVDIFGTNGTSQRGTATAVAQEGGGLKLTLPAGSTIITNQTDAITIEDVGGSSANATAVISDGSNALGYVRLDGNAALAVAGATVKMNNSDGSGLINGTAVVNGGIFVSVNLSESTKTIVADTFSTSITGYPAESFATLNVSASGLQGVTVTVPSTSLLVTTDDAVEIENIAENQAVNGTALVNPNNTLTVKLPANAGLVVNNSALVVPVTGTYTTTITPQVDATGVITGFTLS